MTAQPRKLLTVIAAVLAVLCLGLLGAKAFVPGVLPGSWTAADRATDRDAAITAAARGVTSDFTTFSYQTIDADLKKVKAQATAAFAEELTKYEVDRASLARAIKQVSSGTVGRIGIGSVTGTTAVVAVAVSVKESFTVPAKGDRKASNQNGTMEYMLQIKLDKVDGHWRTASLDMAAVS